MRKVVLITAAVIVLTSGTVIAVASVKARTQARETGPASGSITATRYWDTGPSAQYSGDSGGIGTVPALRLTFPAGSTYDVVMTVDLDYSTSRGDRFDAGVDVRQGAEFGPIVKTTPHARPVAAAPHRTSTTLTFRLTDVAGGVEYWIDPWVNVTHRDFSAAIAAQHVLLVVQATEHV